MDMKRITSIHDMSPIRKSTDARFVMSILPYFLPHSSAGGSTVWSDAIEQGVKSPPTSVLPAAVGGDG